jgi:hypothetical protein
MRPDQVALLPMLFAEKSIAKYGTDIGEDPEAVFT